MDKKVPVRMCIACRGRFNQESLIQIGKESENIVFLLPGSGLKKKYTGRSVYLCKSEKCIANAKKKNLLAKALKQSVEADIFLQLQQEVEKSERED